MRGAFWTRELWHSRHWGWRVARLTLAALLGFYGFLVLAEHKFIFHPGTPVAADYAVAAARPAEGQRGLAVTDVTLTTADGETLHGWWCEPVRTTGGQMVPLPTTWTLLFCHGNAGNVSDRYDKLARLSELPLRCFIFDYRGFGKSTGAPDERGVERDAQAAYRYVTATRGVPPGQVILYGESLGGAVATYLATQVPAAALVLESSFTSVPDMAAATMPFVPRWLVRTQMNSRARLPQVHLPTLVLHGTDDGTIPFRMGQELYAAAAGQPKQFVAIEGADHNDVYLTGGQRYLDAWQGFLRVLPPPPAP